MIWVINAQIVKDYQIQIEFNDGLSGVIDFQKIVRNDTRPIMLQLLDMQMFQTYKVDYDTLCWENGADFAPEYLYEQIKAHKQVA
jgi:hypothetical protein